MQGKATVEEVRIRDQSDWKSILFPAVPLILWLATCAYFWSTGGLDRFQVLVAIVMFVAFAYFFVTTMIWRVFVSSGGIVIQRLRSRRIDWDEVAGFEVKSQSFRGRSLFVVLTDGSHLSMPVPSPGDPRYQENLERLREWNATYGSVDT